MLHKLSQIGAACVALLLAPFNYKIIFVVAPDPKPDHIRVPLNRNCPIMDANAHRPKLPNFFEMQ
jgi:hypothetical protein